MRGLLQIRFGGALVACSGAFAVAPAVAAQGSYSPYDESRVGGARALRPDARLRSQGFRVADRRRPGRARARRRAGCRRLLRPRRRGRSAQPAAAGRHGRGLGRERRCPGGDALFHPRAAARRDASALRLRPRPCLRPARAAVAGAGRLSRCDRRAAMPTRPAAGWRSALPSAATAADALHDARAALREGRSRRAARPRLRPRPDRGFQRRA